MSRWQTYAVITWVMSFSLLKYVSNIIFLLVFWKFPSPPRVIKKITLMVQRTATSGAGAIWSPSPPCHHLLDPEGVADPVLTTYLRSYDSWLLAVVVQLPLYWWFFCPHPLLTLQRKCRVMQWHLIVHMPAWVSEVLSTHISLGATGS